VQVEGETADQGAGIGLRRWFETDLGEALLHEVVDGMFASGDGRFDWLFIGPVLLVGGTLLDPFFQDGLLTLGELLVRVRRRHEVVFVIGEDAGDEFAVAYFAGNEGFGLYGLVAEVEAEIGLAMLRVVAVAVEAVVAQNGPDIAVKLDLGRNGRFGGVQADGSEGEEECALEHGGCSRGRTAPNGRLFRIWGCGLALAGKASMVGPRYGEHDSPDSGLEATLGGAAADVVSTRCGADAGAYVDRARDAAGERVSLPPGAAAGAWAGAGPAVDSL
jgi:hypothetical protein